MSIHPTAVIHPAAKIDPTAEIGPYCVVDEHVTIGARCRLGPHVVISGVTTIGEGNVFHAGAIIGDAPQDLKYKGEPTQLRIGNDNVFREHVTVHRSNSLSEATEIGSNNFLMANSHIGHNSRLGNHIIVVNGALIAGHVIIQDGAFISGNCLIHQFTRIGMLALMQGRAGVGQDLPPFTIAMEVNRICGLNTIGLRRAGIPSDQRLELKGLYHQLFRSGKSPREAAAEALQNSLAEPGKKLCQFVLEAKRGVCSDIGE